MFPAKETLRHCGKAFLRVRKSLFRIAEKVIPKNRKGSFARHHTIHDTKRHTQHADNQKHIKTNKNRIFRTKKRDSEKKRIIRDEDMSGVNICLHLFTQQEAPSRTRHRHHRGYEKNDKKNSDSGHRHEQDYIHK